MGLFWKANLFMERAVVGPGLKLKVASNFGCCCSVANGKFAEKEGEALLQMLLLAFHYIFF